MPKRPIYKHAGIIVKVKKEKKEKKGAKKATTQQASKQFYRDLMGNETENKHLCPFAPKGLRLLSWVFNTYRVCHVWCNF